MRQKRVPMRMCTGCGEMKPKKELVRVVKAPQKEDESGSPLPPEISLDLTGKKPGRGAYLCRNPECLRLARKARRLERAFSCKIPDEVYERMEGEISQGGNCSRCLGSPEEPESSKAASMRRSSPPGREKPHCFWQRGIFRRRRFRISAMKRKRRESPL